MHTLCVLTSSPSYPPGESIAFIGKTHPELQSVRDWEEIAHRATEAALLPKIYPRVSALYEWKYVCVTMSWLFSDFWILQKRYRAENERHAAKNKEFLTVTPAHLNIPKLFWLSHTVRRA